MNWGPTNWRLGSLIVWCLAFALGKATPEKDMVFLVDPVRNTWRLQGIAGKKNLKGLTNGSESAKWSPLPKTGG